jgi:hypothetical protein
MSLWFKPDLQGTDANANRLIMGIGTDSNANGFGVSYSVGNTATLYANGLLISPSVSGSLRPGQWSNILVSVEPDGSTNQKMGLYINGRLVGSAANVAPFSNFQNFIVGSRGNGDYRSAGTYDDIAFYDKSLTAYEAYQLYAQSAPKYNLAVVE